MKGKSSFVLIYLITTVILVSCGPSIEGTLSPWDDSAIVGRQLVLCQIIGDEHEMPIDCILMDDVVESDSLGRFQFGVTPPGYYLIIYDSGLSNFEEGIQRWGGKILELGDVGWLLLEYPTIGEIEEGHMDIHVPIGAPDRHLPWAVDYSMQVLLMGKSPFIVAHDVKNTFSDRELDLIIVEVTKGNTNQVEFQVPFFGE